MPDREMKWGCGAFLAIFIVGFGGWGLVTWWASEQTDNFYLILLATAATVGFAFSILPYQSVWERVHGGLRDRVGTFISTTALLFVIGVVLRAIGML